MTISTLIRKTIAAGDGVTTSFNFNFQVRTAADLQVYYTDSAGVQTLLAAGAYSVVLNPVPSGQLWSAGGAITYPTSGAAIAVGTTLTIVRNVALLQSSSLINQGGYYADVVEAALDVLTMEMQQVNETIGRALVLPISSSATTALPNPLANASIGWDPTGTFITNILVAGTIAVPVAVSQGGTGVVTPGAMSKINWAAGAGTADAITAAYTPANAALVDGMIVGVRATLTNLTTTPTFAPDGLAAHTITKMGGQAMGIGDILANYECLLRYNLAGTRWEFLNPSQPGRLIATTIYTANGTWTKNANTNYIEVEVVSGGGGSGGCSGTSGVQVAASPGGSAGGYGFKKISAPASPQTITIGLAGTLGAAGSGGGNGGTSSFGAIVSVTGGSGSTNGAAGGTINQVGAAGGVSTGGDINIPGEIGGASVGNNTTTLIKSGRGGSAPRGYGCGGQDISTAGNGQTAVGFGSGAGGSATTQGNGAGQSGAAGTGGIIIVREYS